MTTADKLIKRIFDIIISSVVLIFLSWLILICLIIARIDTRASGLFRQNRIGRNGKMFSLMKIRSMSTNTSIESTITVRGDLRITRSGKFFRDSKLDELPQLWNVLVGDMSLVGPRPDVSGYADKLEGGNRIILSVRPGITGPASLYFRDEEVLLSKQENAKEYNDNVIWPQKIDINKKYVENWSFKMDLIYLIKTVFRNA
jgi:lipopolysaccharide/colanic/teichoic acid biosynthesis glycosyltransferase